MTEIKRKANAGERIKIVNANFTFGNYTNGAEMVVEKRVNDRSVIVEDYGVPNGIRAIADYEYVVLEPDAPTTLIPDEALGGVLREYREVKRKASVGEFVKITDNSCGHHFPSGEIVRIRSVNTAEYLDKRDWWAVKEADYAVLEPKEILVINNERFRMVDRKAEVGERVIIVKTDDLNGDGYGNGALFTADVDDGSMCIGTTDGVTLFHEEYAVLEPLTSAELAPTPTTLSELPLVDQYAENIMVLTRKITQLEERTVTLEERILALETDSDPSYVKVASGPVDNALPSFSKALDQAEDAYADLSAKMFAAPPVKSAQQVRDEIVERAKADVNKLADSLGCYSVPDPEFEYSPFICRAEFVVDSDKRKVTVILRGYNSGKTRAVGRSKCAPGETFNSHIGRSIALRRALGLTVPTEYLDAPGPTEVRVGDVVQYNNTSRGPLTVHEVAQNTNVETFLSTARGHRNDLVVLDDSREVGGNSAASSVLKGAA